MRSPHLRILRTHVTHVKIILQDDLAAFQYIDMLRFITVSLIDGREASKTERSLPLWEGKALRFPQLMGTMMIRMTAADLKCATRL